MGLQDFLPLPWLHHLMLSFHIPLLFRLQSTFPSSSYTSGMLSVIKTHCACIGIVFIATDRNGAAWYRSSNPDTQNGMVWVTAEPRLLSSLRLPSPKPYKHGFHNLEFRTKLKIPGSVKMTIACFHDMRTDLAVAVARIN